MYSNWEEDRVCDTLLRRRQQAISPQGGIVTPSGAVSSYPFSSPKYPGLHLLGRPHSEARLEMSRIPPADLIPVNPFQPSTLRDGLAIWDAAVAIPPCSARPAAPVEVRNIPIWRNTNTEWSRTLLPALGRVGRLGAEWLRPAAPYIVDLLEDKTSRRLLEGAHALAHRFSTEEHRNGTGYPAWQLWLARLVVARIYGIPVDVTSNRVTLPHFGVAVYASQHFRSPVLTVPGSGSLAMYPDETVAVVSAAVFIEPHPKGFADMSDRWREINQWACHPTMVMVVGWELVDVVSHAPLCAYNPSSFNPSMGLHPLDLQPSDDLNAVLRAAVAQRGPPIVDNLHTWYVDDWLQSADYDKAVACAPPLPCKECTRMNMRADGSPGRPQSRMPKPRTPKEKKLITEGKIRLSTAEKEWMDWYSEIERARKLVEKAVVYAEGRIHGHVAARLRRKARHAAWNKRVRQLKKLDVLTSKIDKAYKDGRPTDAAKLKQERAALELRLRNGDECNE